MSPPERAKKLSLAVLSTVECVFPMLCCIHLCLDPRQQKVMVKVCRSLAVYPVTSWVHSSATSVSPAEIWIVTFSRSLSRRRRF